VLGVEESTLSIKADFFDLGGHSIKAIKALSMIFKEFGVTLAVKDILEDNIMELGVKIDYVKNASLVGKKEIII
jgi:acyl carrier protein